MNTRTRYFILSSLTAFVFACSLPASAHAMKIFVDLPESAVRVGDTTLLKIMVDTEGQEINAVEGKILVEDSASISTINTGGSILSLWPRKPSLDGNVISFTGGTPAGVYGNSLRLFTIAIKPTQAEKISIDFEEIAGFLNDGHGTKVSVASSPVEIPVLAEDAGGTGTNELATLVLDDKTPPNKFSIDLGREKTLHDGKYFISFYATDNDSGINRYEVKENEFPTVRSGNIYVLQDQSRVGTVEVRAIDNAGNVRIETIELGGGHNSVLETVLKIVLTLLVIGIGMFVVLKIKRK